MEILTDGERLKQEAGWTNSCSKISLLVLSAYWLGHSVEFICSADCDSCLGQVSFIKCMFIFTKCISQLHGCLFSSLPPEWLIILASLLALALILAVCIAVNSRRR